MSIAKKVAAGATASVLSLFGGLAAAGAISGSASSTGTSHASTSTAHSDIDAHSTTTGVEHASEEAESDATTTSAVPHVETNTTCNTNHGAQVSAVAQSDATTGEAHGDAVSAAAHQKCDNDHATSNGPAPASVTTTTEKPDTHANEASEQTSPKASGEQHADSHTRP